MVQCKEYTREEPLVTDLLSNITLSKPGSSKDTRHFVINIESSGLQYRAGDSLYLYPENDPALIDELLAMIEKNSSDEYNKFLKEVNITRASNKLLTLLSSKTQNSLEDLQNRFNGYTVPAIIKELKLNCDFKISSSELTENSPKIMPRAYSIASSPLLYPNEIHLCIAKVVKEINGQQFFGLCSNYLCERVSVNEPTLKVFVHVNNKFRLPEDMSQDIIMVGPGTGIAPFRAFIQERNFYRDQGQKLGRDWLFFGDQKKSTDYLYGEELESYRKQYGLEITTAFSRDQEHKIYVQHRMEEFADEIFRRLENGAYFYVCGDARAMAKDVDETLQRIIKSKGKDPSEYIQALKAQNRYQRDVY